MISVLVSSSALDRLAAARRFLTSDTDSGDVLIIGSSRDAADDLARDLTRTRGATFGLHRMSLRQLALQLAIGPLTDRELSPTTPLGIEAVAARAVFDAARTSALPYFGSVSGCPGFARSVASTLAELRAANLTPADVAALEPAGADLAALYADYLDQLGHARLADDALVIDTARDVLESGTPDAIVRGPVVLLDVPVRSAAERALVRALLSVAPKALVTVPAGDEGMLDALAGFDALDRLTPTSGQPASSLDRLKHHLFGADAPPTGAQGDDVVFFSAPGEARECVEIARRILHEARSGVAFDRIAILLRVPSLYTSLLETALRRAGVPVYFARGTSRPDPSGRAFLALLACGVERLSAKRFAEYLSLGQVPDADPDGAPPLNRETWEPPRIDGLPAVEPPGAAASPTQGALPFEIDDAERPPASTASHPPADQAPVVAGTLRTPWRWEDLLVEAAVIGGRDRWVRRLDGLAAELRLKSAEVRADEADAPRLLAIERQLANLTHLRRFALPLIDAIAALPERAPWGDWLHQLTRLASMALRAPTRVLAVLAELEPMSVVGPVAIEEVRDVLHERLANLEVEPPSRRHGSVFVATPDQVRGRSFEVVFVPGLAVRVFPQKAREDPLLLDQARESIEHALLRTHRHRAPDERLLLRLAVGAAERRAYLSYPRMGTELGEPRPRVPSFYGLDVERATTGRIPDIETLERRAADEAQARLAWPAPPDPALAIDEIEHDLSVLGHLLRAGATRGLRGRARYLLELNPHLARSLRSRWGRWEDPRWSKFDGLTRATPSTVQALTPHRLSARPYSVSALQHYAACPYRFLLSGVYRLEPREDAEPLQHLDPLTRGSIFHEVQAESLRELDRRGQLPLDPTALGSATAVLDATLDRVGASRRDELAPAIPRVWEDDLGSLRADLRTWLHQLAAERDWQPIRFEFGFGLPRDAGRDPRSVPQPATIEGGFKLHGIVDLIERRGDTGHLRVTDHKTGIDRTQAGLIVGGGEVLQPVLYSLAVEAVTGDVVDGARLSFCTRRGGFTVRSVALDRRAREHGLDTLRHIDEAIATGFLPPAPREGACAYCDFRDVCGPHEETRVAHKHQRPLGPLLEMRQQP